MEQPCLSSGNNRISEATSPVSYGLIMLPEKFRIAIYNQSGIICNGKFCGNAFITIILFRINK